MKEKLGAVCWLVPQGPLTLAPGPTIQARAPCCPTEWCHQKEGVEALLTLRPPPAQTPQNLGPQEAQGVERQESYPGRQETWVLDPPPCWASGKKDGDVLACGRSHSVSWGWMIPGWHLAGFNEDMFVKAGNTECTRKHVAGREFNEGTTWRAVGIREANQGW